MLSRQTIEVSISEQRLRLTTADQMDVSIATARNGPGEYKE